MPVFRDGWSVQQIAAQVVAGVVVIMTTPFTAGQLLLARQVTITPIGGDINYTMDGATPPTAIFGHTIPDGSTVNIVGVVDIANIQLISVAGGNVDVTLTLEG